MATILVVDDRAPNREFLVALLGYRGHRSLEAGDGAEALALLRDTPVDLVISDILMPTMDGYELVRRMRGEIATASIPVIFYTAHYNELEARNLAEACGVSRVLTKPAEAEQVLQTVDEVLGDKAPPPPAQPPERFDEERLRILNDKLVERTGELRRQSSHLSALVEMNLQLASEQDPSMLLTNFCRAARALVTARYVVVGAHHADRGPLRHVIASGIPEQASLQTALRRDGAFTDLIANPRSIRLRHDGDPATVGLPAEHPPVHSMIVAPIRSLNHVYGWVCATDKIGREEFTEEDERLLTISAAQVGRVYENGSLYADLKDQTDKLRREVAERQVAEAALARSEEHFHQLFANSPLPKWVTSNDTWRFLEVNDAAVAKYGYSREEFLAMTLRDIRPPEDIARFEALRRRPSVHSDFIGDARHRCKDGRILDVEVYFRDFEYAGEAARLAVIVDITARKEAERQTQRIFETSQDVILVTDGYGNILQVSPSSAKVLGYRPEEMIGSGGQDFILPEDLDAVRNEMRAARRGSATRNFRCRYVHKDGHTVALVWMAVWSEPDRHHFFVGRDMTEYEHKEEQLRQAQKMEAVGQLTGGVAHDFNNVLMIITGNIEALEDDVKLDPVALERIKGIEKATERATELTRQLLAFSRKQALRPQRSNINDLVTATGELLRRTLGEQIEIESILADDLWDAEIDRAQLDAALVNLSVNARDAMPDGGRLLIETRNTSLDEDYAAQNPEAAAGDYVMLAVSDTGQGIPPDVLPKVFEPFFTTKDVGKGTGLGLSMVYGFIKQSGGHIKIYSEVGRGTSMKLYIPRFHGNDEEASARPSQPMPQGKERILIVEDDEQVRAGILHSLLSLGYTVEQAPDGTAGLAAFETAPQPYDLLLTDVIMPGPINGKALADEVTRRWPTTKVVFMSGYTEDATIRNGRLSRGVHLLSKPFRRSDLAQMIRSALEDRR